MGLDMRLEKKTYVKNWEHMRPEEKTIVSVIRDGKPLASIKPERINYIVEEVAYWRKANAIHKWFVDNVQDGNDDCKDYYVSSEKLNELLKTCKLVFKGSELVEGKINNGYRLETIDGKTIKTPIVADGKYIKDISLARELLPTEDGFFFGGTDYDEYYLEDIAYTIDTLEAILNEGVDEADFYYSSSW